MYGYRRQEQYLLLINTYCSDADMGLISSIGYYLSKVFWYVCHLYNSLCKHGKSTVAEIERHCT